jgi:hypothetical protein
MSDIEDVERLSVGILGALERILETEGDHVATDAILMHMADLTGWMADALGDDRAGAILKIATNGLKQTAAPECGTPNRRH